MLWQTSIPLWTRSNTVCLLSSQAVEGKGGGRGEGEEGGRGEGEEGGRGEGEGGSLVPRLP